MKNNPGHPVAVLGLPIESLTAAEAVEAIERLIESGGTHQVASANLAFWLNSISDPHLHRIAAGCSLVLADGMPLVWASRLLGCPLPERVAGLDLLPALAELSERKGYRVFLLGGRAERAAEKLRKSYPGLCIAGTDAPVGDASLGDAPVGDASGPDGLTHADHEEVVRRIRAVKPHILLVGFGNPVQEKWIWMHRRRLGVPVAMGVGASFEMVVGDTRRAPLWVQRTGFEWLIRCVQHPSELAPKYLQEFAALARRLPMAVLAAWFERPGLGGASLSTAEMPPVMHIYLQGKLTTAHAGALGRAIDRSIANGQVAVIHLKGMQQASADGLGMLLDVRRRLLDAGLTLSLADVSLRLRFVLHAWCVQALFDDWQPLSAQGRSPVAQSEMADGVPLEPASLSAGSRLRG